MFVRTTDTTKRLGTRLATASVLSFAGLAGAAGLAQAAHADAKPVAGKPAVSKVAAGKPADAKPVGSEAAKAGAQGGRAQDVIKLARTQVGISEDGSGNTKFNEWYAGSDLGKANAKRAGASSADVYKGQSWCDMFVTWLGQETGAKGMGSDAYTVDHAQWFKDHGRFGDKAKPGAVVFFAWGGGGISDIDHVGIVVKDNGDGTIKTIEGNTGDAVKQKVRPTSQVAGYGYPQYR
ncbi:CHAP domain-containing protein [Actinomadura yumaensis]|uniref:CHAP domain-containing protein n=1 Tax=Actinomadura yumaensis TaxID=111807 RepID=A0ABW2CBM9_9ACTN|nr:CHAP domain-containing protein [Actinomadura sp. J1-007]